MNEHKDLILVTDKISDPNVLNKAFPSHLRKRIMVEAFTADDFVNCRREGYVPMMSIGLLRDYLECSLEILWKSGKHIDIVAMPPHGDARWNVYKRLFGFKIAQFATDTAYYRQHLQDGTVDYVYADSLTFDISRK